MGTLIEGTLPCLTWCCPNHLLSRTEMQFPMFFNISFIICFCFLPSSRAPNTTALLVLLASWAVVWVRVLPFPVSMFRAPKWRQTNYAYFIMWIPFLRSISGKLLRRTRSFTHLFLRKCPSWKHCRVIIPFAC